MDQIKDGCGQARRRAMQALGAAGLAAGALSLGLALPGGASAQQGLGMPLPDEKVADTLQRLFGPPAHFDFGLQREVLSGDLLTAIEALL